MAASSILSMIFNYNTETYPFARIVSGIMGASDLSYLHVLGTYPLVSRETDQGSSYHKKFYENFHLLQETYLKFIHDVIKPIYSEDIAYQKVPSFRVHMPLNMAVGEFHRDKDYGHGDDEMNFWVPLTGAWGTNSIWVESHEGEGDYHPERLEYGEALLFDGPHLRHGNRINDTFKTRVSFDFRVIPKSIYKDNPNTSINTKSRLVVGDYFDATWKI